MADAERSSRRSESGRDQGRDQGRGRSNGGDNTAMRGVILVVIAACVGVFLLVKGDPSTAASAPGASDDKTTQATSTTTAAPEVPATALPAAQLPILAVNGAGSTDGKLASKTRTTLNGKGFSNVKPADSKPKDAYPQTQIFFLPGFEGDAKSVATALGLPAARVVPIPEDPKVANLADAKVVVALGPDAPGVTPPGQ